MKLLKYITILLSFSLSSVAIISCSASTGSRYADKEDEGSEIKSSEKETVAEDFDITKYKIEFDIIEPEKPVNSDTGPDIWYGFDDNAVNKDTSISVETEVVKGYRVLVLTTDNLEEANNMRSAVYFVSNQKNVYVDFEPPFYKVKAGDFTELSDANDLSFKLNQLGYTEARVINDMVTVPR